MRGGGKCISGPQTQVNADPERQPCKKNMNLLYLQHQPLLRKGDATRKIMAIKKLIKKGE